MHNDLKILFKQLHSLFIKRLLEKEHNLEDGRSLEGYEYLLHHIHLDDKGTETVHHCFVYDHIGNLFEQGHIVIKDSKVFIEGKEIKNGAFHVIVGLEPTQEVAWSDEMAEENNIQLKMMKSGMTLEDKSKVW